MTKPKMSWSLATVGLALSLAIVASCTSGNKPDDSPDRAKTDQSIKTTPPNSPTAEDVETHETSVTAPDYDQRPADGSRRTSAEDGSATRVGSAAAGGTLRALSPTEAAIENDFFARSNNQRAGSGVGQLARDGDLDAFARLQAQAMAGAGHIFHSNLNTLISYGWWTAGENVGVGPSVDAIQNAYRMSPGHYSNLASPAFNYIGVGVVVDAAGRIWNVIDFGG